MQQYQPPEIQPDWQQSPYDYGAVKPPHFNVAPLYQDEEDRRASVTTAKGRPKPNYRPVSLRWWYIGSLIAILVALACVVVYADVKLRGSDNTAHVTKVDARSVGHDEAWLLYKRGLEEKIQPRQDASPPQTTPGPDDPPPADTTEDAGTAGKDDTGESATAETAPVDTGTLTTALVEVVTNITSTGPPITVTITSNTVSFVTSDITTVITSTKPPLLTTVAPPPPPGQTPNPSLPPGEGSVSTIEPGSTIVRTETIAGGASVTVPVTRTTTKPGDEFIKLGKTTIFSTFTVNREGIKIQAPTTKLVTSEIPGRVVTSVEAGVPTTLVTMGADGLFTTVTTFPEPITHISTAPPTRTVITSLSQPTSDDSIVRVVGIEFDLTPANVFIGKFLPPLIAVFIALSVRAIDQTAKLYQPFAALSHPLGATGRDSLTLHFDGWKGFWRPFGMVAKGHPVPFMSTIAVWLSSALAPLASGAIGLKIHGSCQSDFGLGCALDLGVSSVESYVLVGALGIIAVLLLVLLVTVSSRWKTGVFADPWCVAGAAALVRNPDIRSIGAHDYGAVKAAIVEKRFSLGWFRNHENREEYGLVLCDDFGRSLRGAMREESSAMMAETAYTESIGYRGDEHMHTVRKPPSTFVALTFWWRLLFFIYLIALIGFIIWYHLGIDLPDNFKKLMAGEKFWVRFISSALGVIIIVCWDCVFDSVAIIAPYRRMANGPKGESRSVLAKRPTYAVTGIFTGIRERDPLLCGVACMAVLSDFLPMLFANVPFDLTQTESVHLVCARVSAGLLLLMALALVTTMFVRWPELPVDPRSVAGEMWYVAEARWVDRLEGVSVMSDRERKAMFRGMGGKWYYGMIGTRMGDRMGVEMHDVYGLMEYSGLSPRRSGPIVY